MRNAIAHLARANHTDSRDVHPPDPCLNAAAA
jgi:hypothetical protein